MFTYDVWSIQKHLFYRIYTLLRNRTITLWLAIFHACKNIYCVHITIHSHDNLSFKQKISTMFKNLVFLYLLVWTDIIIFLKLLYFYIFINSSYMACCELNIINQFWNSVYANLYKFSCNGKYFSDKLPIKNCVISMKYVGICIVT